MLEGIICDMFSLLCFSVTNTQTLKHYGNQTSRVDIDCDKCLQVLNFSFLSLFIFLNLKTILNTVITLTRKQMHFLPKLSFCSNQTVAVAASVRTCVCVVCVRHTFDLNRHISNLGYSSIPKHKHTINYLRLRQNSSQRDLVRRRSPATRKSCSTVCSLVDLAFAAVPTTEDWIKTTSLPAGEA